MKRWIRKTESMHFRLPQRDRKAAEICAAMEDISLSRLIVKALGQYVTKHCPLAYRHGDGMESEKEELCSPIKSKHG